MKTKLLLMLCLFLAAISNYAQSSSATQSGIAVQGIARDVNNTALTNQTINLTFTLYYLDASSIEQTIYKVTRNVTTDAFGVFSDVIDPTAVNNSLFANNAAYLRIEKGSEVISDEKLRHVPYAISANNGVPTGSIMPFIGTVAPEGWALCNGAPLPTTAKTLIGMVGANAPDLRGMFLRGAGQNANTSNAAEIEANSLNTVQKSTNKSHTHTGTTATNGEHSHTESSTYIYDPSNVDGGFSGGDNKIGRRNIQSGLSGNHNHTFRTDADGTATESRPINYGVNYIIKL
ncbi:tail fiber protein [Flavobacterium artemisiae]|uniref:Tail fiber protein n=1 Tax=Flavobacterium artemisiae TaxID=2126556 RepID=A0ABW4HKD1_9FLAO